MTTHIESGISRRHTAQGARQRRQRTWHSVPVIVVTALIVLLWYALTLPANRVLLDQAEGANTQSLSERWRASWALERPILPAPHQVLHAFSQVVIDTPLIRSNESGWSFNKRNLLYHAGVTISATLPGFVLGVLIGLITAIALHQWPPVRRVLLPWLIASQAVPILALAPIIIVMLGSAGITGVLPKAVIAAYLSFFPVVVAVLKGLSSSDILHRNLMATYSASRGQTLMKLSLPASLPYLLSSLRIALSASLAGIIVAELPTGANSGLGARLLAASYYGNTLGIWATLLLTGIVAIALLAALSLLEKPFKRHYGPSFHS